MKLSNYLTTRLSIAFSVIILSWSVIYFVLQMHEIYDGIDEGLNNLKQEFIDQANKSPDFVTDMKKHNPLNIIIEKTSYQEAKEFKEVYSTSKVYFVTEEEDEEVRMLATTFFCEQDQQYYKLKFFTSTVESEDLVKSMLYLLLSLWLCLALAMLIVVRRIIHTGNKPFYNLLDKLKKFKLDNTKMIEFPVTNIAEYVELNQSVKTLLEENIRIFTEQKTFIENASHEIQTPLSVVTGKLELLMNDNSLTKEQLIDLDSILNSLSRMRRLNSSLLLISKIKNKYFYDSEPINLNSVFEEVIGNFEEIIQYKKITLEIENNASDIFVQMNKDLSYILISNLVKNAISHNIKGGHIKITFNVNSIIISNDGSAMENNINIFERYVSTSNDFKSSGLGLSIVKSIVDIYHFGIDYQYKNKHTITLKFPL